MKHLSIILLTFLLMTSVVTAQTKTPTPTEKKESSASAETKDIRDLKEKLEDKVEEMQQSNKKGISGVVNAISSNTIRIQAADNEQYQVKIDDVLTKVFTISGTSKKESAFKDIEKGDYIIAAGAAK